MTNGWMCTCSAGVPACGFWPRLAAKPDFTGRGRPANPQPRTAALRSPYLEALDVQTSGSTFGTSSR